MILLEEEIPSNFTIRVNYMLYRIAEFTDNKTLPGRILIEIAVRFHTGIPEMSGFHYKVLYTLVSKIVSHIQTVHVLHVKIWNEHRIFQDTNQAFEQ